MTFDDGYLDVLDVAAPLLLEFGIRATLFVSTAALTRGWSYPVDGWYSALTGATRRHVRLEGFGVMPRDLDLDDTAHRDSLVDGPEKRVFVNASPEVQCHLLARLRAALDSASAYSPPLLDAEGIERLVGLGWRVGVHGRTHRVLKRVDTTVLETEIMGALEDLEPWAHARSGWLAWPDGRSDLVSRRFANQLGLRGALALGDTDARQESDRWDLPRYVTLARLPFHST